MRDGADKACAVGDIELRREMLQAADLARLMTRAALATHNHEPGIQVGYPRESAQQHFQALESLDPADEQQNL